ncbi:hypothetical protein HDU96_000701 [Phlyctochytrium bullatum]|nr:hypothetical protein HDU96_000701 [Phlyctochytrium bullatum]
MAPSLAAIAATSGPVLVISSPAPPRSASPVPSEQQVRAEEEAKVAKEAEILAQGAALLAELKQLETRAANYNALAIQVFAEETACLKELKEKKRAVQAFLKSVKSANLPLTAAASTSSSTSPAAASDARTASPWNSSSAGGSPKPGLSVNVPPGRKGSGTASTGRFGMLDLGSLVESIKRRLDHVEYQLPRPAKLILRLALGAHAPTTLRPLSHRLQYKKEVEMFKLTLTVLGLGLSALCLALRPDSWPAVAAAADAAFLFTLIYYYSTVTLREHILVVNGSRIRFWWFLHHYLSIVLTGILIIWRSSASFLLFRHQFLLFSAYLGAVQYLQYRYQRKRLYVLVAMDMVSPMDTVSGDGVHTDKIERELLMLVPFLCFGQGWQVYNAWFLLGVWSGVRGGGVGGGEWHVLAACVLFFLLGLGNMITTLRTFVSKRGRPTDPIAPPRSPSRSNSYTHRLGSANGSPSTPTGAAAVGPVAGGAAALFREKVAEAAPAGLTAAKRTYSMPMLSGLAAAAAAASSSAAEVPPSVVDGVRKRETAGAGNAGVEA